MGCEIGMWNGMVYGHKPSEYAVENGFLDYRTLSEIVGDMVLCCGIIANTYDTGEWELYNGTDYDEENDCYLDIYQEYIISDWGAEWLHGHTDEIVYHNERLGLNVWGITHWGTGWTHVLTDIHLVECETLDKLIEVNERRAV